MITTNVIIRAQSAASARTMRVFHRGSMRIGLFGLASVLLLGFLPHAFAFTNGQAASIVIGDPGFTAFDPGATPTGLVGPYAIAFDSSHNLWVADSDGNRVLEYKAPYSTDEAASIVIGQPNFTSLASATTQTGLETPNDLAFDSSGNLWVVDSSNNRVLEYKAPLSTGEAASLVIGQPNFTSANTETTSTGLNGPNGLAFDSSGNLWVADLINGRVLEFPAPFSTGEAATLVIGEPNFTVANDEVSKAGLNAPNSVAFDSSGNLWVVDGHRVLKYNAPFSTHEAASLVIGQNTFTNSSTVTTSTGMNFPAGIAFDSGGNLWISDKGNNRVLEYTAPFSTFEAASLVIGQSNFTTSDAGTFRNLTSTTLDQPAGLAFDSSGNLWVADWASGRVLEYSSSGVVATTTSATSTSTSAPTTVTSASSSTTTPTVVSQSSTSTSTSSSSTGGGGGVPEFPYQLAAASIFTVLLVASYLVVRGRITVRGSPSRDAPSSP
jgi:sugar lactone lactonase YvrE